MQQYTTEWAKEYLREHKKAGAIAQNDNLDIIVFKRKLFRKCNPIRHLGRWQTKIMLDEIVLIQGMLEHPDGWENSKVDRSML